jgi:hypothetical protein
VRRIYESGLLLNFLSAQKTRRREEMIVESNDQAAAAKRRFQSEFRRSVTWSFRPQDRHLSTLCHHPPSAYSSQIRTLPYSHSFPFHSKTSTVLSTLTLPWPYRILPRPPLIITANSKVFFIVPSCFPFPDASLKLLSLPESAVKFTFWSHHSPTAPR